MKEFLTSGIFVQPQKLRFYTAWSTRNLRKVLFP